MIPAGRPAMRTYSFPRSERLKHKKAIGALFTGSDGFFAYPLRIQYLLQRDNAPELKIAISISRRKCRHAVDRNRIRRQIREAWRLQRAPLRKAALLHNMKLHLIILYSGKPEDASYTRIEKAVRKAIHHLSGLIRSS